MAYKLYLYSTDDDDDCNSADVRIKYRPVICSGRQPNSDIFIVGPLCQFTKDGKSIPENEHEYIWVPYIIKKLRKNSVMTPISSLPTLQEPALSFLIKGLKSITGDNFISALFMLG